MFKDFFKKRKMRTVKFGELTVHWDDEITCILSVIFYENDNGKRIYKARGRRCHLLKNTRYYAECETWKHTGLLPNWAKDPIAEKLSR